MPTIQTCFLTIQMTESIKKWSKMVSEGRPKILQKSSKVHPGTLQRCFECMCVPLEHQNGAKWPQGPPKWAKMVIQEPWKEIKINNIQWQILPPKKLYSKQCSLDFNPGNPSNPANPFSLQISSQLVTRGAGGRGEALRRKYDDKPMWRWMRNDKISR